MLSTEVSSTIFKVFGMTRPGIEHRSPGPLANTLPTRLIGFCIDEYNSFNLKEKEIIENSHNCFYICFLLYLGVFQFSAGLFTFYILSFLNFVVRGHFGEIIILFDA